MARAKRGLFTGKTAVVTGAASGMGAALAKKYAEQGANVALLDLNLAGLQETAGAVGKLGANAFVVKVNIADEQGTAEAMDKVNGEFGAVHILANCAGVPSIGKLLEISSAEYDKVMNVNLKSVWFMSRLVARNMIENKVENGKILSISSQASKIGEYGNGIYSISKAGLNTMTQVLALELAEHGISVVAVCPGYVRTQLVVDAIKARAVLHGVTPAEIEKDFVDTVPLGRMAEPEEVADFMVFLSTGAANYITGVSLTMAGGKTLI